MKRTLIGLTLAVSLTAGGASAFDPADLQKLKATGSWAKCDLSGADLSGADLSGAFLMDADLTGANLSRAILCNTIMPDKSVIHSGRVK